MKIPQFKKRILVETGIFTAVIIALAAVTYLLSTISDDYNENNDAARKKVDAIDLELNTLQKRYSFITNNAELYKEVQKKQAEGKLFIKRQVVFEKFNEFRNQFYLNNLRLTVSPVQEIKDSKYKRKTNTVSYSDVTVELDTLYDENVYNLLNAMQNDLSGICVVSRLNLSLQKPVNAEVLQTIGTKGTYPLIKALIRFNWYSINPVESIDNDATKK